MLLVGWVTTVSSLQVGLMVVGGVHIVIASVAFWVLARLYKS